MKLPQHKNPENRNRVATAPYNFVPLPEAATIVEPGTLPTHDRYYPEPAHYTGYLTCHLTAASPLYIRCGEPPAEFNKKKDEQSPEFFTDPATGQPVIPGSSLRGMLRAMVEIVSYSKVLPVSAQKLFFRAVADQMTTLRESYQEQMTHVKAGYVVIERSGDFSIQPAKSVGEATFLKVNEKTLQAGGVKFISIRDEHYQPQYVDCWFKPSDKFPDSVDLASDREKPGLQKGVLICSGPFGKKKQKHWIIPAPAAHLKTAPIPEEIAREYMDTLTDYQQQSPFDKKTGCLVADRPIFYLEQNGQVIDFGPTRNFRVGYRHQRQSKALSARDFVPEYLRQPEQTDFAEALFGYVDQEAERRPKALAGRVSVSDGHLDAQQDVEKIWLLDSADKTITPKILSGPKPTTFAHYLTQKYPDFQQRRGKDGKTRNFLNLSHYGQPGQTVLRGHKLYWHEGAHPTIENDKTDAKESQLTQIKPIKPGVMFEFSIHFENLSPVELGALLWPLHLGADPQYRLKLGMGKPLGMGAVKTEASLHLTNRRQRYAGLFDGGGWRLGLQDHDAEAVATQARQEFEKFILSNDADAFGGEGRLTQLKALLSWPGPSLEKTRYMQIKPNEYKDRKVLPTPTHVLHGPPPGGQRQKDDSSVFARGQQRNVSPGRQQTERPARAVVQPAVSPPAQSQATPRPATKPAAPLAKLPEVGEVFTDRVDSIKPDGTVVIRYKNRPLKEVRALISAANLAGKQYYIGNPARCEVIAKHEQFGAWILECKPGQKKGKGK